MRKLRKLGLLLAAAGMAAGVSGTANAAKFMSFSGSSGSFGNNVITTPTFDDVFHLNFTSAGNVSATISSIFAGDDTNIDFSSVTLNGVDFTNILSGPVEFRQLALLAVSNGVSLLEVKGTSAGNGSYSGSLSFAATAVPEPATWALLVAGFGLVGVGMRTRRRRIATTFA